MQRPHVGVAGALATGREGAGGCGRAVAFSGVLYHNIIQLCVCPSWIRLPAEFLHVDNSTCRVLEIKIRKTVDTKFVIIISRLADHGSWGDATSSRRRRTRMRRGRNSSASSSLSAAAAAAMAAIIAAAAVILVVVVVVVVVVVASSSSAAAAAVPAFRGGGVATPARRCCRCIGDGKGGRWRLLGCRGVFGGAVP